MACGSGCEVPASLHELEDYGFVTPARAQKARVLAWRIVSMLKGLVRALGRPVQTPRPTRRPNDGKPPATSKIPPTR
jgi:hypothetical protein